MHCDRVQQVGAATHHDHLVDLDRRRVLVGALSQPTELRPLRMEDQGVLGIQDLGLPRLHCFFAVAGAGGAVRPLALLRERKRAIGSKGKERPPLAKTPMLS